MGLMVMYNVCVDHKRFVNQTIENLKKIDEIIDAHSKVCPLCKGKGKAIWDKKTLLTSIQVTFGVKERQARTIYRRFVELLKN